MSALRTLTTTLIGWAVLAGLLTLDWYLFRRVIHIDYLTWFRGHAGTAYIGFAVVSWAIDLDRFPDLVSSHPLKFFRSYTVALAYVFAQWATFLGKRRDSENAASAFSDVFDTMITGVLGVFLVGVFGAWLVAVAPAQYFLYLIAGAPARAMMSSAEWLSVSTEGEATTLTLTTQEPAPGEREFPRMKPVTLTNAIRPAILWLTGLLQTTLLRFIAK